MYRAQCGCLLQHSENFKSNETFSTTPIWDIYEVQGPKVLSVGIWLLKVIKSSSRLSEDKGMEAGQFYMKSMIIPVTTSPLSGAGARIYFTVFVQSSLKWNPESPFEMLRKCGSKQRVVDYDDMDCSLYIVILCLTAARSFYPAWPSSHSDPKKHT